MSANVKAPSGKCYHRLAERLGERWMRLYELRYFIGCRFPIDRQVTLSQLFGHPRPNHVDPKDTTSPTIRAKFGDDLYETLGLTEDACPSVTAEGVLLNDDLEASLSRGVLGQARECDLGMRVDAPRYLAVIDGDR